MLVMRVFFFGVGRAWLFVHVEFLLFVRRG